MGLMQQEIRHGELFLLPGTLGYCRSALCTLCTMLEGIIECIYSKRARRIESTLKEERIADCCVHSSERTMPIRLSLSCIRRSELRDAKQAIVAKSCYGDYCIQLSAAPSNFPSEEKYPSSTIRAINPAALCACVPLGSLRVELALDCKQVPRGDSFGVTVKPPRLWT